MPRKPKSVATAKVADIQAELKKKAATPKTISLSDLVKSLAQPIQEMLDAGYSYEDVSDVFKKHGVELAASGIKSFHKKANIAQSTDTSIPVESDEKPKSVDVESDERSESTDSATMIDEKISSQESSTPSDAEGATPSSDVTKASTKASTKATKTQKARQSTARSNSQFNTIDRSSV